MRLREQKWSSICIDSHAHKINRSWFMYIPTAHQNTSDFLLKEVDCLTCEANGSPDQIRILPFLAFKGRNNKHWFIQGQGIQRSVCVYEHVCVFCLFVFHGCNMWQLRNSCIPPNHSCLINKLVAVGFPYFRSTYSSLPTTFVNYLL